LSIDTVIDELQDQSKAVHAKSLAELNGITSDDLARFADAFRALSIQRRRDVIDMLSELAEDNVELSFAPLFLLALDDPDVQVRAQSVKGLWEEERPDVGRRLIGLLDDDEALVRAEAALALGNFLMRAELAEKELPLTGEVEEALRAVYFDERQIAEVRGRALEALGVRSLDWVAELIEDGYNSGDRRLAISAVNAMGRSADPAWLPTLFDEMMSEDPEMRFEAAQAAGELGDEEAVPQLVELTNDEDAEVQEAAIAALGSIGGAAAKSVLESVASETDDERVRDAVAEALTQAEFLDDPLAFKLFLDRENADDDVSEDED
jgi:HEAT repeat protein